MKSILLAMAIMIGLTGCATSGSFGIQKKCKVVENMPDTFVCQEP